MGSRLNPTTRIRGLFGGFSLEPIMDIDAMVCYTMIAIRIDIDLNFSLVYSVRKSTYNFLFEESTLGLSNNLSDKRLRIKMAN